MPCIVVGVGASAGGFEAFAALLRACPEHARMALVLIQHLDPGQESHLAELLSKHTSMLVEQAQHMTRIEPGKVYTIPPNKLLTMHGDHLLLDALERGRGATMPIDHFFRSLARERRELSVGVVLSGSGTDGTLGLKEIKAHGGMTVAQTPDTATHDSMPRSAISTGIVDFVLPITGIPAAVLKYLDHPYVGGLRDGRAAMLDADSDAFRSIISLLRAHTDYDFRCYKKGTLSRRIQRRMGLLHVVTLKDYLQLLRRSPDEINNLFKDLLINVTSFFRDGEAWTVLRSEVIAPLVRKKKDNELLRVWVPGCATGEEAYSLAMLVFEEFREQGKKPHVQIFATDLDADAIAIAREGLYAESIVFDVPPALLERYFTAESQHRLRISREIREATILAVQNLIADPPFSHLDIISCRNVMIYIEAEIQRRMLQMFHFALAPDGYLFLGGSETPGRDSKSFDVVSKQWRIYRKLGADARPRTAFPIAPAAGSVVAYPAPPAPPFPSGVEMAKRSLLERYAPPSVLIRRTYEVQYFHGQLRGYLDIPRGEPTTDVISMCVHGLRSKLRSAINNAIAQKATVTAIAPRVKRGDDTVGVEITVEPLPQRKGTELMLLVSFRDIAAEGEPAPAAESPDAPDAADARQAHAKGPVHATDDSESIQQLEHELLTMREDLQSTIEELETSNEELKASNEEVMSTNEELQSSNEELETSREELQSLNEELSTVNTQLEEKVAEIEGMNDDLTNLLSSTEIATVFLDPEFRIRRFTPATMEVLRVIPTDVGRPISDLAPRFNDPDLYRDARTVLRKLTPIEKKVRVDVVEPETGRPAAGRADRPADAEPGHAEAPPAPPSPPTANAENERHEPAAERATERAAEPARPTTRWFIRKVLPFRTRDNKIDGLVITFTDVTTLTDTHSQLAIRQQQTAAVAHLGRLALSGAPVQELFDEATQLVSTTLGTPLSKLLEMQPDGKSLRIRAGIGWDADALSEPVPAGLDSQAGYTIQVGAPVIVTDLAEDRRFTGPELLRRHGVTSGISVLVGPQSAPWGVLGTHSRDAMRFTVDDANFVEAIANVLYEAIQRREKEENVLLRERQLRLVTDAMPVLIAYCDADLVYRFANAAYEEWFGISPDAVVGSKLVDVIGAQALDTLRPRLERVFAGERVSFEHDLRYARGPVRHVQAEYIPDKNADGEVVGYYAMVEDITRRIEHERASAMLGAIVEQSGEAIIGATPEGQITSWNAAAERMFGYTAEEIRGRPFATLLPAEHRHHVAAWLGGLACDSSPTQLTTTGAASDGRELQMELTISAICSRSGKLSGVSTIARDVTHRLARDRELRDSETRLRMAKEASDLGIHEWDIQNGVLTWDPRMREIWGISGDEPITYERFIESLHPDDRAITQQAVDRALDPAGDGYYHAEYRVLHPNGAGSTWVRASGLVTFDGDRPVRLVGTVMDISEYRRLLDALERADKRKDEFLATLGHELRNPLSAIVNTLEVLRRIPEDGEREGLYDVVTRQIDHMTTLLNDLLDIGRVTRGDIQLRLERLGLKRQIEQAVESLRREIDAGQHQVEVSVDPPDLEVVADPVRLEQILVNLIENAAKYTPEPGRISIRGRRTDEHIEIRIADTGVGLADSGDSRKIFDLFYQTRKGSGGLGIGLSLVKSLVDLHKGTVDATSEGAGEGTTLRVSLPLSLSPQAPKDERRDAVVSDWGHVKVLVVDDHEDSLNAVEFLLSSYCDVRTALDGTTALEEAERFQPDVMLLDLALPDMSGFDVAAAVRRNRDLDEMQIIAMTGFGDSETSRHVQEAGLRGHLLKPINIKQLLELLAEIIESPQGDPAND